MEEEDGATLLLRRAEFIGIEAQIPEVSAGDLRQASALSHMLGGLPLALDQAGGYIRARKKKYADFSFQDYARLYETRRAELGLLSRRRKPTFGHDLSVVAVLTLNFDQVGQEARELLRYFAFLAPDSIPEELITQSAPLLGAILEPIAGDEDRFYEVVEDLLTYSLIERLAHEKAFAVHRVVQAVIQDEMEEEEQRRWAERAVDAIHDVLLLPGIQRVFPALILEELGKSNGSPSIQEEMRTIERNLSQAFAGIELVKKWRIYHQGFSQRVKRTHVE